MPLTLKWEQKGRKGESNNVCVCERKEPDDEKSADRGTRV